MKADEITKIAKVLCPNEWSCEKCACKPERCTNRANAERLIKAGYGDIAQTVNEFAEEVKGACYIHNYSNTKRIDGIIDETAREYCKRRQGK